MARKSSPGRPTNPLRIGLLNRPLFMVGTEFDQVQLFALEPLQNKIPEDHPLRKIRALADQVLVPLTPVLEERYSDVGRPGIPPAILIRALFLQALYSVPSVRALCEQIEYNYLFRWFVGLDWDDKVFDHSAVSKNRRRIFGDEGAEALLGEIVRLAEKHHLLGNDRFVVDGTLIKAWAGMKSFKAKDGSEDDKPNFKNTKRSNKTHESRTDPDARLFRKGYGQESMICHMGHVLIDAASGIIRAVRATPATGTAEVEAALEMAEEHMSRGQILVGDRLYDQTAFVQGIRKLGIRAHPRAKKKGSRLDGRTTKRPSYEASMKVRHSVERAFAYIKGPGRMRQTVFRGTEKVEWQLAIKAGAHNLVRMAKMMG
jgi:transposase